MTRASSQRPWPQDPDLDVINTAPYVFAESCTTNFAFPLSHFADWKIRWKFNALPAAPLPSRSSKFKATCFLREFFPNRFLRGFIKIGDTPSYAIVDVYFCIATSVINDLLLTDLLLDANVSTCHVFFFYLIYFRFISTFNRPFPDYRRRLPAAFFVSLLLETSPAKRIEWQNSDFGCAQNPSDAKIKLFWFITLKIRV